VLIPPPPALPTFATKSPEEKLTAVAKHKLEDAASRRRSMPVSQELSSMKYADDFVHAFQEKFSNLQQIEAEELDTTEEEICWQDLGSVITPRW